MPRTPKSLQAALGEPKGGVYYLHGEDEYRKEEAARALADALLDPGTRDFNYDLVRGTQADYETLAVLLGTPPMMSEWRVILVRETQAFATSSKIRDLLLSSAKSPPEGLALILLCTKPASSTARFYKEMEQAARSFEFKLPNLNDLPAWVMEWARESFGREVTEEAARALVQGIGSDSGILAREIEKLTTLVEEGGTITLDTVKAAGTRVPRQDRWRWFELVGERKFGEAIEGLSILLEHGESGVGLVIGTTTHLLRLGVVADGGARALEPLLPPNQKWLTKRYLEQARRWTVPELEAALAGMLRVDELLKASRMSEEHLLQGWLLERMAEGIAAA
jgi:DNA polymerase-3 subunit delta